MQAHRFRGEVKGLTDLAPVVLAARPLPTPGAFVVCPCFGLMPGVVHGGWVHEVYRLAYEQALAATRPPRHERLYLASSN